MARALRLPKRLPLFLAASALVAAGCRMAPRDQLDDCHRLSQTLRSENARLKDQMVALQSQNQDFSERAVDDARRLAQIEEANRRLETSVQAYQDERTRLEAAYKELRASLPGSLHPLALKLHDGNAPSEPQPKPNPDQDPDLKRTVGQSASGEPESRPRSGKAARNRDAWLPSRSDRLWDNSLEISPPRSVP